MDRARTAGGIAIALAFVASLLPAPGALAYAPRAGVEPGAPVLVSPIDGVTVTSTPVFTWEADVNAREYMVKVWKVGNPALTECSGWVPNLTLMCGDLPPGNYEWTVLSTAIDGDPGGLSASGAFTRATPTIGAPALVGPADGATLDYPDALGVLRWRPAAGAARYLVQVSTSPTFAEGEPDLTYANGELSADVPREHIGVTQYWRVRGVNAEKTWGGPWSATRAFTVTWTDVPTQLSPADGASASNVILSWSPVKGATTYEFEVTEIGDTDFSDAIRTTPTFPNAHWNAWGDIPAGDLRWRVRARNDHWGVTAWSGARTINRDAGAPTALAPDPVEPPDVSLVSPADGATFASTAEVELSWTPVAGAVGYELDLRNATGPWWTLGRVVGAAPIRWRFDAAETFGWRVRALGENGENGAWSDERQLTISDPPPLTLLSPADGGDVPASSVFFTWQPVAGSGFYAVEISDDPAFADFVAPGQGSETPYLSLRGAPAAGRWYWRVRAGVGGTDALSPVRAFDVVDDLAPTGRMNLDGGSTWTAQSAVGVQLEADDGADEVVEAQLSADGTTWESNSVPPTQVLTVTWSLTSAVHGGAAPGQRDVHARFRDAAGNWSAILSTSIWYGMEPPPDDMPPSGTVTVADGATFTRTRHPLIDIPATDVSGVKTISLSTDGVSWVERPYWPEQQVTVSPTNGTKTIRVKWRDWIGNWSSVRTDTIVLDTVAPSAGTPKHSFVSAGVVSSGATPMKFTWTGSDATSGVARYEAALSTDGGDYATFSTSPTTASVTRNLAAGHTYRLRVRPVDKAGNVGVWATGATFSLAAYQEASSRITYSGSWSLASGSGYWGGAERFSKSAGAKAVFTFTGRAFSWIGCTGPARGTARVYVNGNLKQTINLHAGSVRCERVLLSMSWSSSASRKIRIVVSGTAGHPRVGLDAIVTGT